MNATEPTHGHHQSGQDIAASMLVLGGARSGKSRYAEGLIEAVGGGVYLAVAEARDAEMRERIDRHRERRGGNWTTLEEPLDLVGALYDASAEGRPVLIECLTLWCSNLMEAERDMATEVQRLLAALPHIASPMIFVANEVGLGIVPDNALARRFRDEAGRMNQAVAAAVDEVVFVAAGLPLHLKQ